MEARTTCSYVCLLQASIHQPRSEIWQMIDKVREQFCLFHVIRLRACSCFLQSC